MSIHDEAEGLDAMRRFGGPAFPIAFETTHNGRQVFPGLTARDYFAAHALAAMVGKAPFVERDPLWRETHARRARCAYSYADAMLAERTKAVPS